MKKREYVKLERKAKSNGQSADYTTFTCSICNRQFSSHNKLGTFYLFQSYQDFFFVKINRISIAVILMDCKIDNTCIIPPKVKEPSP